MQGALAAITVSSAFLFGALSLSLSAQRAANALKTVTDSV